MQPRSLSRIDSCLQADALNVSVVIPNKNGAGLVGKCVDAALAAGAAEVIVVDDGSTDASPAEARPPAPRSCVSPAAGFAQRSTQASGRRRVMCC